MKVQLLSILLASTISYLLLNTDYNLVKKIGAVNSIGQRMIFVPSGGIDYGIVQKKALLNWYEEPLEKDFKIEIESGFFIGQTEVTQKQWNLIMPPVEKRSRDCPSCPQDNVGLSEIYEFLDKLNQKEGCALDQAKIYGALFASELDKISGCYRLPTQDEFIHACEGGNKYLRERTDRLLRKNSWYTNNSYGLVKSVAQKQANGFGLYDMVGNVDEHIYPLDLNSSSLKERMVYRSLKHMRTSYMMGGTLQKSGQSGLMLYPGSQEIFQVGAQEGFQKKRQHRFSSG